MNNENDIKACLLDHYKRYPRMQIQDAVKMVYQNEFAGGHLINSEEDSLNFLRKEICSLKTYATNSEKPMFESIGNGLYRLHLTGLKDTGINPETANRFFMETANFFHGNIRRFEIKLNVLRQCCMDNELPYTLCELETYLDAYKKTGYPPVSHSTVYREAYSPAYRVVRDAYNDFFEVFCRIDSLLCSKQIVHIAIDGNSGAGKSTLAALLDQTYDCNLFHTDHFFLKPNQRTMRRLNEAGGNIDYERFFKEVITGLKSGDEFKYHIYNCEKNTMDQSVHVFPGRLNIIEGCYSMHPAFIDLYDLKIFLGVDEREQSHRILKRNGPLMHKRFLSEWILLENRYFKEMGIPEKSDLVFKV